MDSKPFQSLLKAVYIVEVNIDELGFVWFKTARHLTRTKVKCTSKTNFKGLSNSNLEDWRKTEINVDHLLESWTKHDIIWLNIKVNDVEAVHNQQICSQRVDGLIVYLWNLDTFLYGKLDTILVYYQIESQIRLYAGTNLKRSQYLQQHNLLDCHR